jgi:hypothetical protein
MPQKTPRHARAEGLEIAPAAHPLMIQAKGLAKKLKKNLALESPPLDIGLMRAQEIIARQLGFESFYALSEHCEEKAKASFDGVGFLKKWALGKAPPSAWVLGRFAGGLDVGLEEGLGELPVLALGSDGSASAAEVLAIQAIHRGERVVWIDQSGSIGACARLAQAAEKARRGAEVGFVSFMTGSKSPEALLLAPRQARLDPNLPGSSGLIATMLIPEDLLDDGPAWKGRAVGMASAVAMASVFGRDQRGEALTLDALADRMDVSWMRQSALDPNLPAHVARALSACAGAAQADEVAERMREHATDLARATALARSKGSFVASMDALAEDGPRIFLALLPEAGRGGPPLAKALATAMGAGLGKRLGGLAPKDKATVFFQQALAAYFLPLKSSSPGVSWVFGHQDWASMGALMGARERARLVEGCAWALGAPKAWTPALAQAVGSVWGLDEGAGGPVDLRAADGSRWWVKARMN